MTPRAGVKTTLASEMRLPGLPDPKRGPHFFFYQRVRAREHSQEYLAHAFKRPDSRKPDCTQNCANCPCPVRVDFDTQKRPGEGSIWRLRGRSTVPPPRVGGNHDVVPIPARIRCQPGYRFRDFPRHARLRQISRATSPQIVIDDPRQLRVFGLGPNLLETAKLELEGPPHRLDGYPAFSGVRSISVGESLVPRGSEEKPFRPESVS